MTTHTSTDARILREI